MQINLRYNNETNEAWFVFYVGNKQGYFKTKTAKSGVPNYLE